MADPEYTKVTIVIENSTSKQNIVIPRATDVEFIEEVIDRSSLYPFDGVTRLSIQAIPVKDEAGVILIRMDEAPFRGGLIDELKEAILMPLIENGSSEYDSYGHQVDAIADAVIELLMRRGVTR